MLKFKKPPALMMALVLLCLMLPFGALSAESEIKGLKKEQDIVLQYATGFTMAQYQDGFYSFTLEMHPGEVFLLVPEGQSAPEGLAENVTVLKKPLMNITFHTTGMVSLVEAINGLDRIATVGTDLKGWYLKDVIAKMEAGDIIYSGNYKEPDFELITGLGVELVVDTVRLAEHPDIMAKYLELAIPYLIESSSKEGHPLGRVEWVKLFGALMDLLPEAEAYFESQVEKVAEVTSAQKSNKTVAMVYMNADGSKVYCRNGGDYMAAMIGMAGGVYIMDDLAPEKSGTTSVTMEEFYARSEQADFLFYLNFVQKFTSLEEMLAFNPLFADLKAVQEGRVYITSPDFSQSTAVIADIIADMHAVLEDSAVEVTPTLSLLK